MKVYCKFLQVFAPLPPKPVFIKIQIEDYSYLLCFAQNIFIELFYFCRSFIFRGGGVIYRTDPISRRVYYLRFCIFGCGYFNMSDEQGAYALTVNLTTQNLFPQSSQGLPVLINETKLQIENLYMI